MRKLTLQIDGMSCGMCESHMNDMIRTKFPVKKVKSSHKTGLTEIVAEQELDEQALRTEIAALGYTLRGMQSEPYEKPSLFGRFGKRA